MVGTQKGCVFVAKRVRGGKGNSVGVAATPSLGCTVTKYRGPRHVLLLSLPMAKGGRAVVRRVAGEGEEGRKLGSERDTSAKFLQTFDLATATTEEPSILMNRARSTDRIRGKGRERERESSVFGRGKFLPMFSSIRPLSLPSVSSIP